MSALQFQMANTIQFKMLQTLQYKILHTMQYKHFVPWILDLCLLCDLWWQITIIRWIWRAESVILVSLRFNTYMIWMLKVHSSLTGKQINIAHYEFPHHSLGWTPLPLLSSTVATEFIVFFSSFFLFLFFSPPYYFFARRGCPSLTLTRTLTMATATMMTMAVWGGGI
jgi:hypothetical protein